MQITMEEAADWLAGVDVPHIKNGQGPAAIPARRAGTPSEVAAVVAFLCRPDASAMTGQAIAVACGEV